MKKLALNLLFLLPVITFAQGEVLETKTETLTKNAYQEISLETDNIIYLGEALFNTTTGKIITPKQESILVADQNLKSRFFAVDPLASKYVWNSPYAFSENRVIDAKELEGLEAVLVHGTFAQRSDKALFSLDKANYKKDEKGKRISTWDRVFSQRLAISSGWNEDSTYEFTWSGENSNKARTEGGAMLAHRLMSKDNPYSKAKHATLIGHSHGGNVNKVAKNILEANGWTVDIINISTPQRKDFQHHNKGKGIRLNIFSNLDLIQVIGVDKFDLSDNRGEYDGSLDSRKDASSLNYKVGGVNLILNWISNAAGHSIHNDTMAQDKIEKVVDQVFKNVKQNQNVEKVVNP